MDLIGLYVVLCGIPGRGHIKILTAGLGWAGAEILLTRFLLLWVGARGAEFDWKYIQKCLESNVNVVSYSTYNSFLLHVVPPFFVLYKRSQFLWILRNSIVSSSVLMELCDFFS